MASRSLALGTLMVISVALLGQTDTPGAPGGPTPAGPALTSDLVVTLTHVGGKTEIFKDEIVSMELILAATGRLDQVHLITKSADEADTHIWYNMDNLVSVRYQFLAITGKGKVAVRAITPPVLEAPSQTPKKKVSPLVPEDYR